MHVLLNETSHHEPKNKKNKTDLSPTGRLLGCGTARTHPNTRLDIIRQDDPGETARGAGDLGNGEGPIEGILRVWRGAESRRAAVLGRGAHLDSGKLVLGVGGTVNVILSHLKTHV